jgi:ABC-type multidrug transport system fused ATPase/permease subunit
MDEASSSVDYATDKLITETLAEEFKDATVLTIGERSEDMFG